MTVRVVREGHGANCSSIGSVIDTLFVAQVTAGAIFAAVAASLLAVSASGSGSDSGPGSDSEADSDSEAEP
jgi:hypothetical protein